MARIIALLSLLVLFNTRLEAAPNPPQTVQASRIARIARSLGKELSAMEKLSKSLPRARIKRLASRLTRLRTLHKQLTKLGSPMATRKRRSEKNRKAGRRIKPIRPKKSAHRKKPGRSKKPATPPMNRRR